VSKERHPTAGPPGFQEKQSGGLGIGFVVVIVLIAFVSGGIVTMAVTGPSKGASESTQAPVSTALPTQPAPVSQTGQTTDPLKQRRPLSDFLSPEEIANVQKNLAEGQTEGSVKLGPTDGAAPPNPITSNPNIPNPEPWQYDPVADKHYDPRPGHQHWHRGRPPTQTADGSSPSSAIPITGSANPGIPNPEPWQYDPATNKFWHPGHQHWHNGQPPPPDQRDQ
jgi:hypothetical protein